MIIFASDLDRTIIYSKRIIAKYSEGMTSTVIPCEQKDGAYLSFMTDMSYQVLNQLKQNLLFIPVTTRSLEQYNRLNILTECLNPPYAILCNGGIILKDGQIDYVWQERMEKELAQLHFNLYRMEEKCYEWGINGVKKQIHHYFFYFILKEFLSNVQLTKWRENAKKLGWNVSLQGRKLYFIPEVVSKGAALKYVANNLNAKTIYAAGDSLLDIDFLQHASDSFIPRHGEIMQTHPMVKGHITKEKGIMAGEEILKEIYRRVSLLQ